MQIQSCDFGNSSRKKLNASHAMPSIHDQSLRDLNNSSSRNNFGTIAGSHRNSPRLDFQKEFALPVIAKTKNRTPQN